MNKYIQLLKDTEYNAVETDFLTKGFTEGFDIGYAGPKERRSQSKNLPFSVGTPIEMWNKIMKEVKLKRVAGPFETVPFDSYIQSPIGLVPKAGNKTRLIFHLSYDFTRDNEPGVPNSVNACTPRELCSVKYNDFDVAIHHCIELSELAKLLKEGDKTIFLGKTDLTSAFRVLCMNLESFKWLIFKAKDPSDGRFKYFVDKCLPFRARISCSHYQRFSSSIRHILKNRIQNIKSHIDDGFGGKTKEEIDNYLDDFLFLAITKLLCNQMIEQFLLLCQEINLPVAEEKTQWADTIIIFLGILLDGSKLILSIPLEKQQKALRLLNELTGKRKITVKQLQVLCGYLNFLSKAIFSGRTFTRRIYAKYSSMSNKLKQHHHITIDSELRFDCEIWRFFLENFQNKSVRRPMVDLRKLQSADQINFTSDASKNPKFGIGATFENYWLFAQWEIGYIKKFDPSIEYLELLGVAAALLTWGHLLVNRRIIILCDNQAVIAMINNMSSSCKNCMYLIRLISLNNLIHCRRVFARFIPTKLNELSDSLSRMQFSRFWKLVQQKKINMNSHPSKISELVWPASSIWQD